MFTASDRDKPYKIRSGIESCRMDSQPSSHDLCWLADISLGHNRALGHNNTATFKHWMIGGYWARILQNWLVVRAMVALRSAIEAGVTDPVVLEAINQRARSHDVFQEAIHAARTRAALLAGPVPHIPFQPQQQQQADVLQQAVRNARAADAWLALQCIGRE